MRVVWKEKDIGDSDDPEGVRRPVGGPDEANPDWGSGPVNWDDECDPA